MVEVGELNEYCESLLGSQGFQDYCPNGLQVEGVRPVRRLMTGVTACQALLEAAAHWEADAVLVHHGYFWKGEAPALTGIKARRIRTLMRAGMSLFTYHLPLDVHPDLGNNRRLGDRLGIVTPQPVEASDGLLWAGRLPRALLAAELAEHVAAVLGRAPTYVAGHRRPVATVAWCTGAAQGWIERAANLGVDAFISGEISEQTAHQARELGLDYVAAGHHATERYGVQALGEHLAERFALLQCFVDIDNPA